jgi:hypothetical protein
MWLTPGKNGTVVLLRPKVTCDEAIKLLEDLGERILNDVRTTTPYPSTVKTAEDVQLPVRHYDAWTGQHAKFRRPGRPCLPRPVPVPCRPDGCHYVRHRGSHAPGRHGLIAELSVPGRGRAVRAGRLASSGRRARSAGRVSCACPIQSRDHSWVTMLGEPGRIRARFGPRLGKRALPGEARTPAGSTWAPTTTPPASGSHPLAQPMDSSGWLVCFGQTASPARVPSMCPSCHVSFVMRFGIGPA